MTYKFGIDEAGRGPLAGPVSVCVFGMHEVRVDSLKDFPEGRDSKKMSEKEREKWFEIFEIEKQKGNIFYEHSFASAELIDQKGIVFAVKFAMQKCLDSLMSKAAIGIGMSVLNHESQILLDGALQAPKEFANQITIIKGDEKEKVIACASIVAKVMRDSFMVELSKEYPNYGFDVHKGYGTKKHRENILKFGLSSHHRKTFIHNALVVKTKC